MNDLLENAKRNSKITLEEFFFEFYSKILEFEQETKIKENETILRKDLRKQQEMGRIQTCRKQRFL